jgi:hypothetical protein
MRWGIAAILVGIGAVILAEQTKPTATKLLLGGYVLKDGYRVALLFVGVALAILGALLAILSASRSTEPGAVAALATATGVLLVVTAIGGGLIYAAYRHAEDLRAEQGSSTESTGESTTPTATTQETAAPLKREYTSPCALYVQRHDARVEITGAEAASDCERFVNRATSNLWTTEPQAPVESRAVVCEVINHAQEHAVVTDTGGHAYGSEACTQLAGEGWG